MLYVCIPSFFKWIQIRLFWAFYWKEAEKRRCWCSHVKMCWSITIQSTPLPKGPFKITKGTKSYSAFANSCPLQTDAFRFPLIHSRYKGNLIFRFRRHPWLWQLLPKTSCVSSADKVFLSVVVLVVRLNSNSPTPRNTMKIENFSIHTSCQPKQKKVSSSEKATKSTLLCQCCFYSYFNRSHIFPPISWIWNLSNSWTNVRYLCTLGNHPFHGKLLALQIICFLTTVMLRRGQI